MTEWRRATVIGMTVDRRCNARGNRSAHRVFQVKRFALKKVSLLAVLVALFFAPTAHAVSLTLGGGGPEAAAIRADSTRALYGSSKGGKAVLLTEVGAEAPGGGFFTEMGVPSITPDDHVLFGAEVIDDNGPKAHWDLFVGDPNAPFDSRVTRALNLKQPAKDCTPKFRGDAYPVGDGKGAIAFTAPEAGGVDAVFFYSGGTLSCLARASDVTSNGHALSVLGFGTAQMAGGGAVVFNAWLKGDKQAMLIASKEAGLTEIAVEDEAGPNNIRYKHPFGLPATIPSPEGPMVAFVAKTITGSALFVYRDNKVARLLPTGTNTSMGPVSYISLGRPGLMPDGTTAVLVGCARVPAILRLVHGRLDLPVQRGFMTPSGTELVSLGDPSLTASGAMYLGAIDTQDSERLYVLGGDNSFFEAGSAPIYNLAYDAPDKPHSIFTGTVSVNQHGDYAYLGGK